MSMIDSLCAILLFLGLTVLSLCANYKLESNSKSKRKHKSSDVLGPLY
jgi:hypothetical protein